MYFIVKWIIYMFTLNLPFFPAREHHSSHCILKRSQSQKKWWIFHLFLWRFFGEPRLNLNPVDLLKTELRRNKFDAWYVATTRSVTTVNSPNISTWLGSGAEPSARGATSSKFETTTSTLHWSNGAHRVFAQPLCFVLTDEEREKKKVVLPNQDGLALHPRTSGRWCAVGTKSHKWANTTANASANRSLSVRPCRLL